MTIVQEGLGGFEGLMIWSRIRCVPGSFLPVNLRLVLEAYLASCVESL